MKSASYHPGFVGNFDLDGVEVACKDGKRTVEAVRGTTLGEEGGDVVVGVDRYDGDVKRSNRSSHVSKQGHVHRKGEKPIPAGSLPRAHRCFHVQSQMCA